MKKEDNPQSEFIRDAYRVVAEGLRSMQHLQSQTAAAHQKFLETQTEANRALQEMMKSTQRLAEGTIGISAASNPPNNTLENGMHSPPVLPIAENVTAPGMIDSTASPSNSTAARETDTTPPSPADLDIPHAAANGYAKDEKTPESRIESIQQSPDPGPDIETTLLNIVSRLTGYPVEMLGLDMDIEAELGIDSIKRVEILSNLEEAIPQLPAVSPEIMGSLKTLGQIVEFVNQPGGGQAEEQQPNDTFQAASTAPSATSTVSADDRAKIIEATMLEVVSRLTGYPVEMLGLDMDIEAELGIDSIKRVEILSTLEEKMPDLPAVSPDMIGSLKTLGQISEYLANPVDPVAIDTPSVPSGKMLSQGLSVVAANEPEPSLISDLPANESDKIPIPRSVVTVVEAPPVSDATVSVSGTKKVFVTEDHTGLSEEITEALAKLNIKTVRISLDILKYKSRLPEAAGLIIVQDPRSDQMHQDLKDAFRLAKFIAPNLIASAGDGGAIFATVTRLDGAFGLKRNQMQHPIQGGLAGLAKTAAIEWEDVCCHAIDIAPDWSDKPAIASAIVRELMSPGPVEIGLDSDIRCTLALETEPRPTGSLNLDQKDVVVISGGARGVTAAAAFELARRTGTKLALLGRSPEPFTEPQWLSALEAEADIKKALLENEYRDQTATPAEVEKTYKRYMANREISGNLKKIRSTGASVYYYSADVRKFDTVEAIIDSIRLEHGPVTGIIHGAGVLEDRLIIDKTEEQFERVYDTKVSGLNNLLKATHQDPLKYLVLFSSVAARLGNKGQVDYAIANEVLNKMAQTESAVRTDCRVISINWGPWDGGMVTTALKREFERNGIHLIPTGYGAESMIYEMMAPNNSSTEIVIGAELSGAGHDIRNLPKRPELVKPAPAVKQQQLALSFERQIDLDQYPILQSHIIDGKPVVPLALMTEWFAHGALHENPGLVLNGLDDIRVMKGIRMEQDQKHIRLLTGKLQKNGEFYEVAVELRDGNLIGKDIVHAKAKAILSDSLTVAPDYQFSKTMVAKAYTRKVKDVYDKILFHGLQLHGIRKIVSCSSRGMVAHISTAPSPGEWIATPLRNQWIADPLVLDCAFQMATVWCFEEKGVVSLPSYGASYRQYCGQFPSDGVTVVLEIKDVTPRRMRGDFTFLNAEDAIVARLNGYEAIMDASLFKAFKPQFRASA
jgi:NAD(P)-dependent dehydrogenase (short-subunit alcohol dehydrogenase family)/acyl carrier protein